MRTATTPQHGTRVRYNQGCRCHLCKEANRIYGIDLRKRQLEGDLRQGARSLSLPPVTELAVARPPVPDVPGAVEAAIRQEIEGLALAATRPALVETALSLARNILDNPRAVSHQAAAAGKLADVMDRLHKGADQRKSRLASVRAMTQPVSQTGT